MATLDRTAATGSPPVVITTREKRDLGLIVADGVQAVVCTPHPQPHWIGLLADAIGGGSATTKRSLLPDASREEVRAWFHAWVDEVLPTGMVAPEIRVLLQDDVSGLVDLMATLGGVSRFRLRVLVGAPNNECGFHVDTVAPGAPSWGLLRVYNGAGTEYADPLDVRSLTEFHRYLRLRERLERSRARARRDGDEHTAARVATEIADLDSARPFLRRPDAIQLAPAGSIVAFKHADIRDYWSDNPAAASWIHCSPMAGCPRLVVNVTSPQWARGTRRAAAHAGTR